MTARSISAHAPPLRGTCGSLDLLALRLQPSRPASGLQGSGQRLPTCDPEPATDARVSRSLGRPTPRPARFRVLGPLEVSGEEGALPLGGPKQRNDPRPPDPEREPGRPCRAADRRPVGRGASRRGARNAPDVRLSTPDGARIEHDRGPRSRVPAPCRTRRGRCLRFERLLRDARRSDGEPRVAAATLAEALDLWRGPALADLATEPIPRARDRPVGGTQAPGHGGGDRLRARPRRAELMPSRSSRGSRVSTRCASGCGAS